MSNTPTGNVQEYYRQITEVDIHLVARELLGPRIVEENGRLLQCDCPNHKSTSRRSLHIWLDKQGFFCHACRKGGDVLQLVEFIQSRTVTAGRSGPMPETHKRARDYLAAKASLPPLGQYGLSPEQLKKIEAERKLEVRVGEALTALAEFYHRRLKEAPKVLEWLHAHYGISGETIDSLQIGFAANGGCKDEGKEYKGVLSALTKRKDPFKLRELAATGAFNPTSQDSLYPFFDQRLIFPYWSHGRVVFMIGRQTPWTPDNKYERGRKYKKLRVHKDDHKNDYIAPSINNSHLYNEDCLLTRPERVIITEGVTDCIALMERGFPVVSPVTVHIRESDWSRLLPKLQGVKTVYICQDNEISEVGLNGALKTASVLTGHKIETKLVVLPLDEKQQQARRELRERFDLDAAVGAGDLPKHLDGRAPKDMEEAGRLLAAAKIDVNDYFASGHTAKEFETLLGEATTPLEFGIDRLPTDVAESARNQLLEPILREVAALSPLEQSSYLKRIQERFGKSNLSLTTLRAQVKALQKERKAQAQQEQHREKHLTNAPAGSCRARINEVLMKTPVGQTPDYTKVAEAAYQWFTDHGAAQFFFTRHGEPFLHFDNAIYWMDSADRGRKRQYAAMLYKQTGLVPTSYGGRTFFEVLPNLALIHGQMRDHFSWLHTDVPKHTVYFNLNRMGFILREPSRMTPSSLPPFLRISIPSGVILTISWASLFQLDRQKNGITKAGIGRVDADPRRLMKLGYRLRVSHQLEGAGHRLAEGRAVQFVDSNVGRLQRKALAITSTATDRYPGWITNRRIDRCSDTRSDLRRDLELRVSEPWTLADFEPVTRRHLAGDRHEWASAGRPRREADERRCFSDLKVRCRQQRSGIDCRFLTMRAKTSA